MAHHEDEHKEQVHYVGDSRVKVNKKKHLPKDYAEFPGNTEAFFPDFLLKEWMVAVVFLVGFMTLVLVEPAPIAERADPTNSTFLPVPDWYFLFLYQLLKYKWASGKFVVLGTIILPGIAFGALTLVPWLDRSHDRRPHRRPLTISTMLVTLVAISALTWAAEYEHLQQVQSSAGAAPKNTSVIGVDEPGYRIYQQNACIKCHGEQLQGGNGPGLIGIGNRMKGEQMMSKQEIIRIIDHGRGLMPAGMFQGSQREKDILADWLMKQTQK